MRVEGNGTGKIDDERGVAVDREGANVTGTGIDNFLGGTEDALFTAIL